MRQSSIYFNMEKYYGRLAKERKGGRGEGRKERRKKERKDGRMEGRRKEKKEGIEKGGSRKKRVSNNTE